MSKIYRRKLEKDCIAARIAKHALQLDWVKVGEHMASLDPNERETILVAFSRALSRGQQSDRPITSDTSDTEELCPSLNKEVSSTKLTPTSSQAAKKALTEEYHTSTRVPTDELFTRSHYSPGQHSPEPSPKKLPMRTARLNLTVGSLAESPVKKKTRTPKRLFRG